MCGGRMGPPFGIPLSDERLASLPADEQIFWHDFLGQSAQEISAAKKRGEQEPLIPSNDLREKYFRAVTVFGGQHYCQVAQLENIFDFTPVS